MWRNNFGRTVDAASRAAPRATSSAGALPEPATTLLVLFAATALGRRRMWDAECRMRGKT
jgi:hypothetical protein